MKQLSSYWNNWSFNETFEVIEILIVYWKTLTVIETIDLLSEKLSYNKVIDSLMKKLIILTKNRPLIKSIKHLLK